MRNYSVWRGMVSENAVERALLAIKGEPIIERRKKMYLRARVINFVRAVPNDELDRSHTDFLVTVESDVNAGILSVPIQTRSSERRARSFGNKCRRKGWGPIQVVVVELEDTLEIITAKVKAAIIRGYNIMRRYFNEEMWRFRSATFQNKFYQQCRPHGSRDQWCPRFNTARMSWH